MEAMDRYGTNKPDLRNPLEIIDVSDIFKDSQFKPFRCITMKAIVVLDIASKSNSWFNELAEYATSIGMPGIGYFKVMDDMFLAGPIDKFLSMEEKKLLIKTAFLKPGSVIFFYS